MRSFEQRIEEINRRSEKILKERKKRRKYILAACIPLVLCLTLAIAWLQQTPSPTEPEATLRVYVSGDGFRRTYKEEALVKEIYNLITSLESQKVFPQEAPTEPILNDDAGSAAPEPEDPKGNASSPTYGAPMDSVPMDRVPVQYRIKLTLEDGSKMEYVLCDNTLENLTTGETTVLNTEEVKALKALLEIPPTS